MAGTAPPEATVLSPWLRARAAIFYGTAAAVASSYVLSAASGPFVAPVVRWIAASRLSSFPAYHQICTPGDEPTTSTAPLLMEFDSAEGGLFWGRNVRLNNVRIRCSHSEDSVPLLTAASVEFTTSLLHRLGSGTVVSSLSLDGVQGRVCVTDSGMPLSDILTSLGLNALRRLEINDVNVELCAHRPHAMVPPPPTSEPSHIAYGAIGSGAAGRRIEPARGDEKLVVSRHTLLVTRLLHDTLRPSVLSMPAQLLQAKEAHGYVDGIPYSIVNEPATASGGRSSIRGLTALPVLVLHNWKLLPRGPLSLLATGRMDLMANIATKPSLQKAAPADASSAPLGVISADELDYKYVVVLREIGTMMSPEWRLRPASAQVLMDFFKNRASGSRTLVVEFGYSRPVSGHSSLTEPDDAYDAFMAKLRKLVGNAVDDDR